MDYLFNPWRYPYVANIDHSPTIVRKHTVLEDRLENLLESHLMQAHQKMADWASPPGIPPLYKSYTQVNPGPLPPAEWGYNTVNLKGDAIYLHFMKNPRGKSGLPSGPEVRIAPIRGSVDSVVWMNRNRTLSFQQVNSAVVIQIDEVVADTIDTIIKVRLAQE